MIDNNYTCTVISISAECTIGMVLVFFFEGGGGRVDIH